MSKLLNGHAVAVLLKEFGDRFTPRGGHLSAEGASTSSSGRGGPEAADPVAAAGNGGANGEADSEADKMQTLRSLAVRTHIVLAVLGWEVTFRTDLDLDLYAYLP